MEGEPISKRDMMLLNQVQLLTTRKSVLESAGRNGKRCF